jgi:hypothetical protein
MGSQVTGFRYVYAALLERFTLFIMIYYGDFYLNMHVSTKELKVVLTIPEGKDAVRFKISVEIFTINKV